MPNEILSRTALSKHRGGLTDYVSASRLSLWLRCPLAFKFRYVDGIRTPPSANLFLGKRVHDGLEYYYRHAQAGVRLSGPEVARHIARHWGGQPMRNRLSGKKRTIPKHSGPSAKIWSPATSIGLWTLVSRYWVLNLPWKPRCSTRLLENGLRCQWSGSSICWSRPTTVRSSSISRRWDVVVLRSRNNTRSSLAVIPCCSANLWARWRVVLKFAASSRQSVPESKSTVSNRGRRATWQGCSQ